MGYKTKEWRKSMPVTVDYNKMMAKSVGDRGIKKRLNTWQKTAAGTICLWAGQSSPITRQKLWPTS